jgi:hypothetical protein
MVRCSRFYVDFCVTDKGSCEGTNNFAGNVLLEDMQLPSDNPGGGIDFVAVTQLNNTRYFSA